MQGPFVLSKVACKEAFRVLKPGGRFAVSDVVVRGRVPADMVDRKKILLWVQIWHASIAFALAILWMAHLLNPYLILVKPGSADAITRSF
jgi:ubiquinone/menaquinone biosynthesis C-methylase UbiE